MCTNAPRKYVYCDVCITYTFALCLSAEQISFRWIFMCFGFGGGTHWEWWACDWEFLTTMRYNQMQCFHSHTILHTSHFTNHLTDSVRRVNSFGNLAITTVTSLINPFSEVNFNLIPTQFVRWTSTKWNNTIYCIWNIFHFPFRLTTLWVNVL